MKYRGADSYGFNDFDRHMCLKPGVWTWLVVAFLMRPYVVIAISFANKGDRMGLIDMIYPDRIWLAIDTLAALPAVAMVLAYALRSPSAGRRIRWLWGSGRALLMLSAGANAVVALASLILGNDERAAVLSPSLLCVSAWSLWYLISADRVKDAFGDFPATPDEEAGKGAGT